MLNYIYKHLNGDFSLGRSFWLHGFFGYFLYVIVIVFFREQIALYLHFYVFLCIDLAYLGFLWVGILQSATRHPVKWQRRLAAGVVFLFMFIKALNVYSAITKFENPELFI